MPAQGGPRELSFNQWRRLCAVALREEGSWIDPADARSAIGKIKLGLLASPREFRHQADGHADGDVLAGIYELYERQLAEQGIHDFDDLVLIAVRALREDPELRRRWQSRFEQVLVDEYQDIEPAQELLVRILAAPQDGFFCVGDEDQTLYGWRRASVRRIIDLDLAYRVWIASASPTTTAVRRRSSMDRAGYRTQRRALPEADPRRARPHAQGRAGTATARARRSATGGGGDRRRLADRRRDQVVVLARTTNLLRTVALACAGAV